MKRELTFDRLRAKNVIRCEQAFHQLHAWSPRDWALAMIGEAGETCNAIKKLHRYSTDLNIPKDLEVEKDCIAEIAREIADTIIYADLLAARLDIDLGEAIREKFNIVSDKVGSDVKL
jgi:NTP pyrophosphatase (non-canonical NTP hydrolase)